jgi:flavin-dependent dehydrogenase
MSERQLPPTLTLESASGEPWDAVVIGAGPAGATAARELAREGSKVLLVDRASFPRHKVCGCCLNGAALGVLQKVGLGGLPKRCDAIEFDSFHLASRGRFASVPLREGVSLSRERLDVELIKAATASGAEFLDQTLALVRDDNARTRAIELKRNGLKVATRSSAIVVAGGLGCRVFAKEQGNARQTSSSSRVGAGTVLDDAPGDFASGTIYMACHRDGYVGLVRLEDGRLDVATAFDAKAIKEHGGVGALVEEILSTAGLPIPPLLASAVWQGTGNLTQHRQRVSGSRYFVIGDAAGYVEPFTGEGMAWALATGKAVASFVSELQAAKDPQKICRLRTAEDGWIKKHRELIRGRARLCRTFSTLLRYPTLVSVTVRVLARAPVLAHPVVKALNAPFATN